LPISCLAMDGIEKLIGVRDTETVWKFREIRKVGYK
jgi:hypothetical protein